MRLALKCAVLTLITFGSSLAQAHFVWIGVEPDAAGKPVAHVWFGEAAAPGEGDLAISAQSNSASSLLRQASEARAVWHDFPGFTAQLAIHTDEHSQQCRLLVSADGEVKLEGAAATDDAVVQAVQSLVMHRLAGSERRDEASFVDERQEHPLGRLIKLNSEDEMHSAFRVRGDVLTQVNRSAGDSRFTINVLDVTRNVEGKYLPHVYAVSYWDSATGALRSTSTSYNTWTRVGKFDLPATVLSVGAQENACRVKRLEFTHHKLLEPGRRPLRDSPTTET